MTLLYTARGELIASSEAEAVQLGEGERITIGALARRFLAEGRSRHSLVTLMGELRFERLVGTSGQEHVVVSLTPPHLFKMKPLQVLTQRQREIAAYAATGASATQIGAGLEVSVNTVKHHLKSIYLRLQVRDREGLRSLLAA